MFTVSVGNLPAGASVLIKITYVAELQVEGENIVFSLPGTVAPWKQEAALEETTQVSIHTCTCTVIHVGGFSKFLYFCEINSTCMYMYMYIDVQYG